MNVPSVTGLFCFPHRQLCEPKIVRWPQGSFKWSLPNRKLDVPAGCGPVVLLILCGYLALGVLSFVAWRVTDDAGWVVEFLHAPAALLTIGLAIVELWLSVRVTRHFAPGESMRPAWMLIAASAGCDLAGLVCSQVLGTDSLVNPLTHLAGFTPAAILKWRDLGLLAGGSLRFALLAIGLDYALRAYRRTGLMGRPAVVDWVLLGGLGVYELRIVADIATAIGNGHEPTLFEVLSWPVDPLLWFLLAEALWLFRSVRQLGDGSIGRCWRAYSVAIFLTALGNIAMWAARYGYLAWSWSSLTWSLWLPAAIAFALAPAYQLEAMRHAAFGNKAG